METGDVTWWCLSAGSCRDELPVLLITSTHQTKLYTIHSTRIKVAATYEFRGNDRALISFTHQRYI